MAVLQNCCCYDSVRKGSFASAVFTLAFYTIVFTTCAFHVNAVFKQPVLFVASLSMLMLSLATVVSSIVLIVGLYADNSKLLIPWILCVSLTTILDVIISFWIIYETTFKDFNLYLVVIFIIDLIMCSINIYSILCVISQYQEYRDGRGFASHKKFQQRLAVQNRSGLQVPNMEITVKSGSIHDSPVNSNNRNYGYLVIPSPGSSSSSVMRSRMSTDLSSLFGDNTSPRPIDDEVRIVVTPDEENVENNIRIKE